MDNVSLWLKLLTGNTAQVLLIGALRVSLLKLLPRVRVELTTFRL